MKIRYSSKCKMEIMNKFFDSINELFKERNIKHMIQERYYSF